MRGTAFGIYNLIMGIALLFASLIAGSIWSTLGAQATFITGGGFALLTVIGLIIGYRRR
jgi:hypothetical protein